MRIRLLCVGRLKERFYAGACAEYVKRLSRFANVEIVEVADERAPESLSEAQKEGVKRAEGRRLLSKLRGGELTVALDVAGKQYSSEEFAGLLDGWLTSGKSAVAFIIGGSLGLSGEVLERAELRLSFSRFTFCHQLMRVILLEQVFRAAKINAGEPYHK